MTFLRVLALVVVLSCAVVLVVDGRWTVHDRTNAPHAARINILQPNNKDGLWADSGDRALLEDAPSAGAGGSGQAAGSRGSAAGSRGSAAGSRGSAAGSRGSAAGSRGSAAGSRGSAAGSRGSAAGSRGSAAGSRGSAAGSRGSAAGSRGSAAGSRGSEAGDQSTVVTAPTAASGPIFPTFPGSFTRGESGVEQKMCRIIGGIYIDRYISKGHDVLRKAFDDSRGTVMTSFCKGGNGAYWGANIVSGSRYTLMTKTYKLIISQLAKDATTIASNQVLVGSAAGEVDSQATCGNCWAQTAIDSLEVALQKEKRYSGRLSVQQLVDCVYPGKGCDGGSPLEALDWLSSHPPILESNYPTTNTNGTCLTLAGGRLAGKVEPAMKSHGWEPLINQYDGDDVGNAQFDYKPCTDGASGCAAKQHLQELDMVLQVVSIGPFFVYVDTKGWDRYQTGVFPPTQCSNKPEDGNHLVQLTGIAKMNEQAVWVIKNSWGTQWGMNGFIYLPVGYNACGIANFVARAKVEPQFEKGARSAQQITNIVSRSLKGLSKAPPKIKTKKKGKGIARKIGQAVGKAAKAIGSALKKIVTPKKKAVPAAAPSKKRV